MDTPKKFKIKLMFTTSTCCDWLEKKITVTPLNWKTPIRNYYLHNKPEADALVDKWRSNCEDVDIWIDVENIDAPKILWHKILRFVDEL
mgnify:CR=1 FL=1